MSERDVQAENHRWAKRNFWDTEFKSVSEEIVDKLFDSEDGLITQFENGGGYMTTKGATEAVRGILFKRLGMFMPFVGMVEELGELAHALLKKFQGIRTGEDHDAAAEDAYGDGRIFGLDFCSRMGWIDREVVEKIWDAVKKRDWIEDPEKGGQ